MAEATTARESADEALAAVINAEIPEFTLFQAIILEEPQNEIAVALGKKCRSLYCTLKTPKVDASEVLTMRIGAADERGIGIHAQVTNLLTNSLEYLYGAIKIDCAKGLITCMIGNSNSSSGRFDNLQLTHSIGTSTIYLTNFHVKRNVGGYLYPAGTELSVYAQEF